MVVCAAAAVALLAGVLLSAYSKLLRRVDLRHHQVVDPLELSGRQVLGYRFTFGGAKTPGVASSRDPDPRELQRWW